MKRCSNNMRLMRRHMIPRWFVSCVLLSFFLLLFFLFCFVWFGLVWFGFVCVALPVVSPFLFLSFFLFLFIFFVRFVFMKSFVAVYFRSACALSLSPLLRFCLLPSSLYACKLSLCTLHHAYRHALDLCVFLCVIIRSALWWCVVSVFLG